MPQKSTNDLLTPQATGSRRFWVIGGLVLFCGGLALASYAAYRGQQDLVRSHQMVMGRVATEMVTEYVEEHEGEWPRSWHDVATIDPGPPFNEPGRKSIVETMQSRLIIDFQADPATLAQQPVEEFVAIRPRGADMELAYRDYWNVKSLLETLRKHHPPSEK
jgi:hypothetical protein